MILRRIIAALTIVAAAVLTGFRGGSACFAAFYFVILVPLTAFIYSRAACARLYTACEVPGSTVVKGDQAVCRVMLRNESVFPLTDVRLTYTRGQVVFEGAEDTEFVSLSSGENRRRDMAISCRHCGRFRIGLDRVEVRDFLGMFRRVTSGTDQIIILPRVMHLQRLIISPEADVERQRQGARYRTTDIPDGQIKTYTPGDDVRRIHWKASALQGRLMVRNYVAEPRAEIVLIPDSRAALPEGEERFDVADAVVEGTVAIADYFRRHEMFLRVITAAGAVTVSGGGGFDMLYKLCSDDFFTGAKRPHELMREDMLVNGTGSCYVVMTWELDEELLHACSACVDAGADVSVIYIGDDESQTINAVKSSESRIDFYQVFSGEDVFDVLGGISAGEADA
jgi:uncharacterized protein (DUF58 family)